MRDRFTSATRSGELTYYDRNHDGRVTSNSTTPVAAIRIGQSRIAITTATTTFYSGMAVGAAIYKHHRPVPTGMKITKGPVPVLITDYGQSVPIPRH